MCFGSDMACRRNRKKTNDEWNQLHRAHSVLRQWSAKFSISSAMAMGSIHIRMVVECERLLCVSPCMVSASDNTWKLRRKWNCELAARIANKGLENPRTCGNAIIPPSPPMSPSPASHTMTFYFIFYFFACQLCASDAAVTIDILVWRRISHFLRVVKNI